MKYEIEYEKSCIKYLKKLDKNTQVRIINAINQIPYGGRGFKDVQRITD